MNEELKRGLEKELADWRARLDRLRVQFSLGKMELRDRERKVVDEFMPAYESAMRRLGELKGEADKEARALKTGMESGWKELRRSYEKARSEFDGTKD